MSFYPSIRNEGGLFGPDLLDQLTSGELPGQRAADFGLAARRNLTDEIASAYTDARALWGVFQHRLDRLKANDMATTVTRDAWVVPFLGLLGYELRLNSLPHEIDGLRFPISHRAGEQDKTPPVHVVGARQELGRVPASGRPRMAPHSLVQEFLNRDDTVWGLVTNGLTLRLLRDCTFVRRQAYVEFDPAGMLEEQRFQDFAALYRLLHRTRLPRGFEDASDCLLERYYAHSVEQGGRVREHLRDGVEQCLTMLANGFLRHLRNDDLRRRLSPSCGDGDRMTPENYYRQLLTLVYRLLFLLVSEDRGLLSAEAIYQEHYGIARLRHLLDYRGAFTEHDDLWRSLSVLWYVLAVDQLQPAFGNQPMASALGMPVLNGDLFAVQTIDGCTISNRNLLEAFWRLAFYQESPTSTPRRVNYAAVGVEELGSVYESLLEYHPTVDLDHAGLPVFRFITGSERKTTGSYYTPPELVGELIKSALEPVIADRLASCSTKQAKRSVLLSIRVCDPACGSGHFLLAAARRLGRELARVETGEDEPAPERVREATREAVSHCIYGVDKNPLAVDLCRVALWLESHAASKPLTFLDHRIRPGDSLVGVFDLPDLKNGIPDKAFDPLEGDDKTAARELARRNRDERAGARDLPKWDPRPLLQDFNRESRALGAIADDSPSAIHRKKDLHQRERASPNWIRQKQACDLWTAAFFQPLEADKPAITTAHLAEHLAGRNVDGRLYGMARSLSDQQLFFHWPLEFPEVFADGGFDVLLSNPPWEHVELKEQEFFAVRDARVASAKTKAERTLLIERLATGNPSLFGEYVKSLRALNASRLFLSRSGRCPLTARGRINTYAVFAELATEATSRDGRAGLVLPRGIATDDTTKFYFGSLVDAGRLTQLIGFENEEFIFPAVDHRVTFCALTIGGGGKAEGHSRIAFYIRRFPQLAEENRFFSMEKSDFWLLNPNTGNCPIFRTQADAELTKAIYRRVPILWREGTDSREEENPWRLRFLQGLFNMASDSKLFFTAEKLEAKGYRLDGNIFVGPSDRYLPLYEAKMLHHFDHRFSTYAGATESQLNVGILPQPSVEQKQDPHFVVQPRYWVREDVVEAAIPKYPEPLAAALALGSRSSIQRVLCWWAAGYFLNRGREDEGDKLLLTSNLFDIDRSVLRMFGEADPATCAANLERGFPLNEGDVTAISQQLSAPQGLARELVERFSPRWFLGWRDICRATDERTMIASAVPKTAVGHTFPLLFTMGVPTSALALLLSNLNSLIVDYISRQKVGGTHITYGLLKQFPVLPPDHWLSEPGIGRRAGFTELLLPRALELLHTARDLANLAKDCCCTGPPFVWNADRRFEIRCELDAAFFHLYLPADDNGYWTPAEGETSEQLAALRKHFPTPRDAVGFIMDQFPVVRQKDEQAHGRFRTKERILEIYDAMLDAQRTGRPYQTTLDPPPGQQPGRSTM